MLNISVDLGIGQAKLAQTTPIKAGGDVPVTITFSANPGDAPAIELALSPQSSTPSVKAYLAVFEAQNQTVYTGWLNTADSRLIALLVGKQNQTLDCEIVVTTATRRQPLPNFAVAVQPPMIVGAESSEGGPDYLTPETADARYLRIAQAFAEINAAGAGSRASARANIGAASQADVDAKIPLTQRGQAEGVATLDAGGKVPVGQLPDSVLGQVSYKGTWEADTNTPDLTALDPAPEVGDYYVISSPGDDSFDPDGAGRTFDVGDWLVFNGTNWDKIDNTEPFADESVAGISLRASTEDAQAAEDDTKHLTPAKGKYLLDYRLASAAVANQQRDASQIVTPATLRSQTTANVSATLTLVAGSDLRQILAPQTTDRDVVLPAINAFPSGDQVGYGHAYEMVHDGSANSLLVKDASSVLQARIDAGESAAFIATSSGWIVVKTARYGVTTIIYPGIDLTAATGTLAIFTPVSGMTFHPISAFVRNDTVSGTISTAAELQIDNGTNGQDVFATAALSSPAAGRMFALALATQPWLVTSTAPLRLRRTVAAAGTTAVHSATLIVNGVLS